MLLKFHSLKSNVEENKKHVLLQQWTFVTFINIQENKRTTKKITKIKNFCINIYKTVLMTTTDASRFCSFLFVIIPSFFSFAFVLLLLSSSAFCTFINKTYFSESVVGFRVCKQKIGGKCYMRCCWWWCRYFFRRDKYKHRQVSVLMEFQTMHAYVSAFYGVHVDHIS